MPHPAKKIPGPAHPITVETTRHRVVVYAAGEKIAESHRALKLQEANYPPVFYLPRSDVNLALLTRSEQITYCPYKGECSYYTISSPGTGIQNAVWSYEQPHESVEAIQGYLAFDPTRVDSIEVT